MKFRYLLLIILLAGSVKLDAQILTHGDVIYRARNDHAGNKLRMTIWNNGRVGTVKGDQSKAYAGEWPLGSGKVQMGYASAYVMSEIRTFSHIDPVSKDSVFVLLNPAIACEGWDPNLYSHDSLGRFQGFEPLPGYLNLTQKEKDPYHSVAMSQQAFTWPATWPDKLTDASNPGWGGHWNGYFGKDQMNADEESYYVMDDYQFDKKLKGLRIPSPIAAEPKRGGLGLRMAIRGLQWSNPDAQDCIFWLYDIKNIGEKYLDKTLFGLVVGAASGGLIGRDMGNVSNESSAKYYRDRALAVNYEVKNVGVGGYSPVPWAGFAFLESPGNPFDGIDNDADAGSLTAPGGGTGKIISDIDFYNIFKVDDQVVLINYDSPYYDRTISKMPAAGIKFTRNGETYSFKPNVPYTEIPRNGIDDNLNGLIDENDGALTQDSVQYYLYIRSQYNDRDYLAKDFISGNGIANQLIDERRNDGIDNDGDWRKETDDVGIDGKPGTGDEGEGDGLPTKGRGDLPGEPGIDFTDIHESDQIGLTSFKFYRYGTLTFSNDDQMWDFSRPGYTDNSSTDVADYDYVFSSGFFPLRPESKEFFSVSLIYGWDEPQILRNKDVVQTIYNSNYNFAVAPLKPTVTAVAGDQKVTLYWDDVAETSYDRFLRQYNFEGYKIYRATYATFEDAGSITDGLGYERFKKPLVIYDKIDSVYGYFPKDFGTGVLFNLGNETGLTHTYVDNNVINGVKYFYAVTAYSKGDLSKNVGPTETTIFINIDQSGVVQMAQNVVTVTPQAPSAGFTEADFDIAPKMAGSGLTRGFVGVNLVDPTILKDGDEYEIQFLDKTMDKLDNDFNGKVDSKDPGELIPTETTGFVLKNKTQNVTYDTAWIKTYKLLEGQPSLVQNLYMDKDGDPSTFSKIVNGMDIVVKNPVSGIYNDTALKINNGIKWSQNINPKTAYYLKFSQFALKGFRSGTAYPRQYKIVFYDEIVDTSDEIFLTVDKTGTKYPLDAQPVNFKAYDLMSGEQVHFGISDQTVDETVMTPGFFSAKDNIIFYEKLPNDSLLITYSLLNNEVEDTTFIKNYGRKLGKGDTVYLYTENPFNSNVKYVYKIKGQKIDQDKSKQSISKIKVVPNPYVVTALWEPHNPYGNGRGPRRVDFIHLPQRCTIRIYAIDGTLVRKIDHDSDMRDGSEPWDLMTKDNMEVAYGVYVYHIESPGIGETVGKIFIIK